MAKFNYSTIFFIIFGVATLVDICNSATTRSRKVIVKKKKIVVKTTTTSTTSEPPPEGPITFSEHDSSEDSNGLQESSLPEGTYPAETLRNSPERQISSTSAATSRNPMMDPRILKNCDECIPEDCETPPATICPIGLIMDYCNCCYICASVEGNRCYNATLGIPFNPNLGVCGPGLACQLRNDLEPYEQKEALCECGTKSTICGTDNKTYQSECKLHEAAHLNSNLTVKNWHACYSAPSIPANVENVTVAAGDDVSLSCEVRAFPPPVIHWQFQAEDSNSRMVLPGDDSSVVVTIRGGPEQIMTTSWIQFVSVTPKRQGVYFCLAKNEEGMTQSSAIISVYKNQN